MRYLTVSASSVSVEPIFSTTGHGKRSNPAPHKLLCAFVHDNCQLLDSSSMCQAAGQHLGLLLKSTSSSAAEGSITSPLMVDYP